MTFATAPSFWVRLAACLWMCIASTNANNVGQSFSSMEEMKHLVATECEMVERLLCHSRAQSSDSDARHHLEMYDNLCSVASKDNFLLLNHPMQTILYFKRIFATWSILAKTLNTTLPPAYLRKIDELRKTSNEPSASAATSSDDIDANVRSIFRLQLFYGLSPMQLCNLHEVYPAIYGPRTDDYEDLPLSITAREAYEIAVTALSAGEPCLANGWLKFSQHLMAGESLPTVQPAEIVALMVKAYKAKGNLEKAEHYRNVLDELNGNRELKLVPPSKEGSAEFSYPRLNSSEAEDSETPAVVNKRDKFENDLLAVVGGFCRGEIIKIENATSMLNCFYKSDTAFTRLARLKAELLHDSPQVILFRGLLSDAEAETVISLSRPKLKRSHLHVNNGTIVQSDDYRISASYKVYSVTAFSAWLQDEPSALVADVSKRSAAAIGLQLSSADPYQVVNYGFGGHCELHYDHAEASHVNSFYGRGPKFPGNRIGTVLIFLNQPEAGGATIFPLYNIAYFPQKGDALVWFNLLRNGSEDMSTLHAGCPVLAGSKWIATKWFHEYGQEFLRPCTLNAQE